MSIITTVVQVNDKNTRTVNTQKGEKQVISTPIIKDSTGKWVSLLFNMNSSCLEKIGFAPLINAIL